MSSHCYSLKDSFNECEGCGHLLWSDTVLLIDFFSILLQFRQISLLSIIY